MQAEIDEARPGDLRRIDVGIAGKRRGDARGELARLEAERLRQHHRRIGGEVAVGGVARRLDDDPVEDRGRLRRRSLGDESVARRP